MRPELSPMVTRSPGFTDLSASRMMPLMKLATIFCNPKPMPTPAAPEKIASAERLMPTALMTTATAKIIRPSRIILTSSTWIEGVRSLDRVIRLSDEIAGDIGQPQRHHQQHAELDQQQRRQPQAAEHDRNRVQRIDGRIELAEDAQRRDHPCRQRHQADDEVVADHRGDRAGSSARPAPAWRRPRAGSCGSARSNATSRHAR